MAGKKITGLAASFDVAWAAGLLDGEGYISVVRGGANNKARRRYTPRICIAMTDLRALQKVQSLFGGWVNGPYYHSKAHHQKYWQWAVTSGGKVETVVRSVLPFLTTKKRTALRVLAFIETRKRMPLGKPLSDDNKQVLNAILGGT